MRTRIMTIALITLVFSLFFPADAIAGNQSLLDKRKSYAKRKYGKGSKKYEQYLEKYVDKYTKKAQAQYDEKLETYKKKYKGNDYLLKKAMQEYEESLEKKYGVDVKSIGGPSKSEEMAYKKKMAQEQFDKDVQEIEKKYGVGTSKAKKKIEERKRHYEHEYGVEVEDSSGDRKQEDVKAETEKWQKQLEKDLEYYEDKYGKGSKKAMSKVEDKKEYYEKKYGVDLDDPTKMRRDEDDKSDDKSDDKKDDKKDGIPRDQHAIDQLTEKYNKKLQDLADDLHDEGMNSDAIAQKVKETKVYYEEKYDLALDLPKILPGPDDVPEITVNEDDTWKERYVKDSIRRLGGIISDKRPVSTLIGDDYSVRAGFKTGVSIFDRKLLFKPPIGFPERNRPKRLAVVVKEVIQ